MKLQNSQLDSPAPKLGRVIQEVEQRQSVEIWQLFATGIFVALFFFAISHFGLKVSLLDSVIIAAVAFSVSAIIAVTQKVSSQTGFSILRLHENGVSNVHGESTEINYSELHEYTCTKTSYSAGDYFSFEFKSHTAGNPKIISWLSKSDTALDLDQLHLRISNKLAQEMAAKLKLNHRIPFGDAAFICHNGIECKVGTGIRSTETTTISWAELKDMKFLDAKLLLSFEVGKWNIKIPCSEPNVFAGYLLVDHHLKTLFGDWMPSRQTAEELSVAFADRVVVPGIY